MKRLILLISVLAMLISVFAVSSYGQRFGKVYDIDGNKYKTVKIGDQTWMKRNLRVTTFNNGDPIFNAKGKNSHHAFGKTEWEKAGNQKKPAWCHHTENPEKRRKYHGKLYNYYVVEDSRKVCPDGWRVPSERDWRELVNYLGGKENEKKVVRKLKARYRWKSPWKGTNESSFSALPGNSRFFHGGYWHTKKGNIWWSSTGNSEEKVWSVFKIWENNYAISRRHKRKQGHHGRYIRCIKEK